MLGKKILRPRSLVEYTAAGVVLDVTTNWGGSTIGFRQIDFYYQGSRLPIGNGISFSAWQSSYLHTYRMGENVFDTLTSYTGSVQNNGWQCADGYSSTERLKCIFPTPITFDTIVFNNFHDGGMYTDRGAKDFIFYATDDASLIVNGYGTSISGNHIITYSGQMPQHSASNVREDWTLPI